MFEIGEIDIYMAEFKLEQKCIHRLLLQSFSVPDLGLFYGKMGITLCFFEYGRYTDNCVYIDIGEELLDDILEQIHIDLSFCFDSGLSGIAWGIEYLLQNRFLIESGNDIFEEIDNKIMQINLLRMDDHGLDTGLEGLYYYISARIQRALLNNTLMPFDLNYFKDLSSLNPSFNMNNPMVFCSRYPLSVKTFLRKCWLDEKTFLSLPLGLNNGIAGCILNKII